MAMARSLSDMPHWPIGTGIPGRDIGPTRIRRGLTPTLRRQWRAFVTLPDRGLAASDDLPAEFFRFPPF
jgi:hypothetical protein